MWVRVVTGSDIVVLGVTRVRRYEMKAVTASQNAQIAAALSVIQKDF